MKCVENREKHNPQRGKLELPLCWSDDDDGSHLSNQSYWNRSDSPAPEGMGEEVVSYQSRCKKKHLLEKGI